MVLDGELRLRPTRLALAQDTVVINAIGGPHAMAIDHGGAEVSGLWRPGKLVGVRTGPCLCPNDTASMMIASLSSTVLSGCTACLREQGTVHSELTVHRRVELLGLHFQDWKKRWGQLEHGGSAGMAACGASDFRLTPEGFQCLTESE